MTAAAAGVDACSWTLPLLLLGSLSQSPPPLLLVPLVPPLLPSPEGPSASLLLLPLCPVVVLLRCCPMLP